MDQYRSEIFTTKSNQQTRAYAARFARRLKPGDIILLSGPLGSGKTTFTKAVVKALSVDLPATSPTFQIINHYRSSQNVDIYHVDLFRLNPANFDPTVSEELHEVISKKTSIIIIEWPEHYFKAIQGAKWKITFMWLGENSRRIEITEIGSRESSLG